MPGKDPGIFQAAQEVMDNNRAELERAGVLIMPLPWSGTGGCCRMTNTGRACSGSATPLLDDADEQPPAALDLAGGPADSVETWAMAFASDGRARRLFRRRFPRSWQRFTGRGRVELVMPAGWRWLGLSGAPDRSPVSSAAPARPEGDPGGKCSIAICAANCWTRWGKGCSGFVEAGVPPAEIAVIAPLADKVLEHTLMLRLNNIGVPLNVLI